MRTVSLAALGLSVWALFYGHWGWAALLLFGLSLLVRGRRVGKDFLKPALYAAVFTLCSIGWPVLLLATPASFPGLTALASAPHWVVSALFNVPGPVLGIASCLLLYRFLKRRTNSAALRAAL
jgi:hypothetical protein